MALIEYSNLDAVFHHLNRFWRAGCRDMSLSSNVVDLQPWFVALIECCAQMTEVLSSKTNITATGPCLLAKANVMFWRPCLVALIERAGGQLAHVCSMPAHALPTRTFGWCMIEDGARSELDRVCLERRDMVLPFSSLSLDLVS